MKRTLSWLALGLGALTLGACENVGKITRTETTPFYSPLGVGTASAGGLLTEIYGPAVLVSDDAAILSGIRTPSWAGSAKLVRRAAGFEPASGDRLVLLIGSGGAFGDILCRNPQSAGIGGGTPLQISAALCIGDEYYSRGTLSLPADAALGSPAYQTAMNQLMHAMILPFNPETDIRGDAEWPF